MSEKGVKYYYGRCIPMFPVLSCSRLLRGGARVMCQLCTDRHFQGGWLVPGPQCSTLNILGDCFALPAGGCYDPLTHTRGRTFNHVVG